MFNTLHNSHPCLLTLGIARKKRKLGWELWSVLNIKCFNLSMFCMRRRVPNVKRHGSSSLCNLTEEFSACLHLQHISKTSFLEYRGLGVTFLILSISSTDQHID